MFSRFDYTYHVVLTKHFYLKHSLSILKTCFFATDTREWINNCISLFFLICMNDQYTCTGMGFDQNSCFLTFAGTIFLFVFIYNKGLLPKNMIFRLFFDMQLFILDTTSNEETFLKDFLVILNLMFRKPLYCMHRRYQIM